MHRSRLGRLAIDCQTEDLEAAVEFWGQALRRLFLLICTIKFD